MSNETRVVPVEQLELLEAQISGGLCYFSAESKHMQLKDAMATVKAMLAAAPQPAGGGGDEARDGSVGKDDVLWVVNDMGELGVKVFGRCFFLYKGHSLEYTDGTHDDGAPILYREVGKREFGETVWPVKWISAARREDTYDLELVHTPGLSHSEPDDPRYKWSPLPVVDSAMGVGNG